MLARGEARQQAGEDGQAMVRLASDGPFGTAAIGATRMQRTRHVALMN